MSQIICLHQIDQSFKYWEETMKRIITIFLIVLLSVTVFAGCSRHNGNVSTDPNGKIGTSENNVTTPTMPSTGKNGSKDNVQNNSDGIMDDIGKYYS